jgi:Methyltransferase domain
LIRRGALYSGLDLTEESIWRVGKRFSLHGCPYVDLKQGSPLDIPYPSNSFDIVFSHGVLHHIPEIDRAQREIARVLKPDGELIAMLYAKWLLNYLLSIAVLRRLGLITVASDCRFCISGVLSTDEGLLRLCYRHCLGAVARFAALATNTRAAKRTSGFRARADLVCPVPVVHALINGPDLLLGNLRWNVPLLDLHKYPSELGSWFSVTDVKEKPELAPHREFFANLERLSDVEQDDALKKQAVYNITHHPAKFAVNWAANVGRLLFSYPFSLGSDRLTTYFYMAPNIFVVVLLLLSLFPAALRPRAIPFEMWALLIFALTAFGGSTLLSAYDRQFRPLVPILCAWMAFVYVRVLRIDLRGDT